MCCELLILLILLNGIISKQNVMMFTFIYDTYDIILMIQILKFLKF